MSELINSLLNFLTGTGIWKVIFSPTGEGHGIFDLADSGWAINPTAWQLLVMYAIVAVLEGQQINAVEVMRYAL